MNLPTRRVVVGIGAVALLAGGTALWAGGRKEPPDHPSLPVPTSNNVKNGGTDHLKGLKGVWVFATVWASPVVRSEPRIGLGTLRKTMDTVEKSTEATLRRKGIPVLTMPESLETRGWPRLHVSIKTAGPAFYVDVAVEETVRLERSPTTQVVGAPVWHTGTLGIHGGDPDVVVKAVEETVEQFCNDYLKAKPK